VVVYDEGGGRYAGRFYWILKYMGVANAKILDGGLEAWIAGRKPVTNNPTIVLFCGSGVRTGKGYVALVNILGYNNVKIYDGGYNEWVALNNTVNK
jgi:3-mercaptopyruvate sulfurtransferase SseA